MPTVQIENIDRVLSDFRTAWDSCTRALTAWWGALQPGLLTLARQAEAIEQARRAGRRRMHTAYSRRLRARRKRSR